jgi:hypothetical protein
MEGTATVVAVVVAPVDIIILLTLPRPLRAIETIILFHIEEGSLSIVSQPHLVTLVLLVGDMHAAVVGRIIGILVVEGTVVEVEQLVAALMMSGALARDDVVAVDDVLD